MTMCLHSSPFHSSLYCLYRKSGLRAELPQSPEFQTSMQQAQFSGRPPPGVVSGELDILAFLDDSSIKPRYIYIYIHTPQHPCTDENRRVFGILLSCKEHIASSTCRPVHRTFNCLLDHTQVLDRIPWRNPCLERIRSTSCHHLRR